MPAASDPAEALTPPEQDAESRPAYDDLPTSPSTPIQTSDKALADPVSNGSHGSGGSSMHTKQDQMGSSGQQSAGSDRASVGGTPFSDSRSCSHKQQQPPNPRRSQRAEADQTCSLAEAFLVSNCMHALRLPFLLDNLGSYVTIDTLHTLAFPMLHLHHNASWDTYTTQNLRSLNRSNHVVMYYLLAELIQGGFERTGLLRASPDGNLGHKRRLPYT